MSGIIKKIILLTLGICVMHISKGQPQPNPAGPQDWVIRKNYYATYLLLKDPALTQQLCASQAVSTLLKQRFDRFKGSDHCANLGCFLEAFKWKDSEIELMAEQISSQIKGNRKLAELVESTLMPSKTYGIPRDETAKVYLKKALLQDFGAMNYVVDVYGGGKRPNYPKIDSISFDVNRKAYFQLLDDVRQDVLKDIPTGKEALFMTMMTAVRLLEIMSVGTLRN